MKKPSFAHPLIIGICLLASTQLFGQQLQFNELPLYDSDLFVNSERVPFLVSVKNISGRTIVGKRLTVYYQTNTFGNPEPVGSAQIDSLRAGEDYIETFFINLDSSIFSGRQTQIEYYAEMDSIPSSAIGRQVITMNLRNWGKPKAKLFNFDLPDTARVDDTLRFNLKLTLEGIDYIEGDTVKVFSMVNNDRSTIKTLYSEQRIIRGQERDTLNIKVPMAVNASEFNPGGGNVVVIWPIGFLKNVDSAVTDTVVIGWPVMVEENTELDPAFIYPTIGHGDITVSSQNSIIEEVRITDLKGRTQKLTFADSSISLEGLSPGSYMISVLLDSGGMVQRRVIILKNR